MTNFNVKGTLMIITATMIWGAAFAAQRLGMEHMGPFTFVAVRFFVGGLVTALAAPPLARLSGAVASPRVLFGKKTLIAGLLCGAVLFVGSTLQQVGMQYTTVGKTGFLTSLYVILVPVSGLFFGRRPRFFVWIGMAMAMAGIYFLALDETFSISFGDTLIIICAVFFTIHILLIDRYARGHDGFALSSVQFFTVSAAAAVLMFIFETPRLADIIAGAGPILYTGVLSCGVAYTLQVRAQKITAPAIAAILLGTESVFAALSGYIFVGEILTRRELLGCTLVFVAVIVAQLDVKKKIKTLGLCPKPRKL